MMWINFICPILITILTVSLNSVKSARTLTPLQRSFTPVRNISCSQCDMRLEVEKTSNYVETDMLRRRCMDEPDKYFKPCPITDDATPRGCGKLITFTSEPTSRGHTREVTLMKRFCASEGAQPEEVRCDHRPSLGGFSELCICGDNNCNSATNLRFGLTSLALLMSINRLMVM